MLKTVVENLTPQNEKKFNQIHNKFSQISNMHMYEDVSAEIIKKLNPTQPTEEVKWLFLAHSESRKLFALNVDDEDYDGWTALHCAVREKSPEIANALIEAKVSLEAKTWHGSTALHLAALANYNDNLKIGRMLLDAGADVNARDNYQRTPLSYAIMIYENYQNNAELLVEMLYNAKIEIR